ncbi:S8 family peptidase [Novosphingobium sp. 32-60-15]|uniref:S8 family peptidase n=1 Tax=Novosphingobium sp. 32-60-15 TaxID=1970410 RepID=UPI0025EE108C|nr:S8 family peptidase [Novosphingobium sp. 32-60-15]
MPSDPTKPLLRLTPDQPRQRPAGPQKFPRAPESFPQDRQQATFAPKFDRLAQALARDASGLELRADPAALAPERLLVFEVRGSVSNFAAAVQRVNGLELIDEEELGSDDDKDPIAYLLVPDARALAELLSLWKRWNANQLQFGETPWRGVFELLRDLRPWGPQDRVQRLDAGFLAEEIEGRGEDELVPLEIELIYRTSEAQAQAREDEVRAALTARGGQIISHARLPDIAYHALLVDLPVRAIREIIDRAEGGIASLEPVMHIRPQSLATTIEIEDATDAGAAAAAGELRDPILALLDGVPVAAHPLLAAHLVVDDQFDLEPHAPVNQRVHGTAMASLLVHGDRNNPAPALPRRIHVVPVMGSGDRFPARRLVVDIIYLAIRAMREGADATAPGVLIVNLSLGNERRPFQSSLSAWARLLDRLAYRYGILFLVSAGNVKETFGVPAFATGMAFEDADAAARCDGTLTAIGSVIADRRMFSPSEAINAVTVGASNDDWVSAADRRAARAIIDPFPGIRAANPSSALGPGFARSVKPDILMPGGREHLRQMRTDGHVFVRPAASTRPAGLKVAAPRTGGIEIAEGYSGGTSGATALASRTCHRIHDALEAAYPDFAHLPHIQRAVLIKALLVHPARWPDDIAARIKEIIGPVGGHHSHIKDNIRRFLGFGYVDAEDAVACAEDRATFWAVGELLRDRVATVRVPVPAVMSGQARPHSLSATLAWFTPVQPGRKSYRSVRLKLLDPAEAGTLSVSPRSLQPDGNQTNRGTIFMRCWEGDKAPVVGPDMMIDLVVQRDPDPGTPIDEAVPFGLAITIAMPGLVGLYTQVAQRLGIAPRQPV